MANRDRDYHPRDPHFDGELETVINDATGSNQMGIMDEKKPYSPFKVQSLKTDPKMKEFSKFVDGE
ncbi:hypothetical protein [Heyndrickxia ginsengihumi]|uniref:Uncharacterized protein n=1 Tax=Heyndrickxia ginsengihumi TaxID=363870 RepID=A0A0A6Y1C9_9BACI|nr:hypothetical protein [Heyndrickxia ginsengihumi]KHD86107.1 hypothetical protein NG54_04965 [Heyndrickxia ginsengihumi]MBE6184767.1 hypothetical protein [Bacillus sp. (in: firmicutes)]MCM3023397.1 hypothetical protein [Heyndrickxia ginsengihumi]NEY21334.1 hypothetical protein [Heyndrickxia ginsengihumi]